VPTTVNALGQVEISEQMKRQLAEINAAVNSDIRYTTDMALYRTGDLWKYVAGRGAGDCDDYAITKKIRLRRAGWPAGCARLTLCWTEGTGPQTGLPLGEGYHAVLAVCGTKMTWILDNRHAKPMRWDKLAYTWHRWEVPGKRKWESLMNLQEDDG
jgi:predicted transglutaminase-like cysteine proteinase